MAATAKVREIELEWIPLADGTRLSARLWLPEGAERAPVPAILEYVPYRRRDSYRERDNYTHSWFAENGYACLRVDVRGTGDSDGVIRDEYLPQEQSDGVEVIDWIARQPWCSGAVGMMGISWGGFNSLQVAALRPPALKAIVTACSTDDRYADDMHYMGGCVLNDTMHWGTNFLVRMARGPDSLMVGEDRWRAMWLERLEGWEPPFITWLEHQTRDAYWKQGSVCEDYGKIDCAVFAVGGWGDGYSNAIFRMLANLKCPRIGVVGPWGHEYPHRGEPGPAIGFLQECKRWWDQWLKGCDTGIMREPMLRAWMQDSVAPAAIYDDRPGRWVGEPSWPSPAIEARHVSLGRNTLAMPARTRAEPSVEQVALDITSPQHVGQHAGQWCGYGGADYPTDQREEDGASLVFDSEALSADLVILGAPIVELDIVSDQPAALVAVRLNGLRSDGASERVTYGVLNLTHRDGHEHPKPLEAGKRTKVRVQLNEIGHVFAVGQRLRLAISTAYWPIVWPSPRPVQLTVYPGTSRLTLPVRSRPLADEGIRFEPAVLGRATPATYLRRPQTVRTLCRDVATNEVIHTKISDLGRKILHEIDMENEVVTELTTRIRPDDPTSARVEERQTFAHRHPGGWEMRSEARGVLSCTETEFLVEASLHVQDGGKPFFVRSWLKRIPRNGV